MPSTLLNIMPRWMVPIIGILLIVLIGYIDYVTGDYSILVFYLLPVAFVCWYHGRGGGILMAVASGIARFASDVFLYKDALLHYWNSVQDMIFLLVVSVLVSFLHKELTGGEKK